MIPQDKQPAFSKALEAAFGVRTYDAIEQLAGADGLGLALVYRVVVAGRPYLLRFLKEGFPGSDPARELAFMQSAAEAGVAPRILYASVEDRLLISDFVDARPFPPDAAARLAATLRRLHALPGLTPTTRYLDKLDGFIRRLGGMDLLPRATAAELIRRYDEAAAVYPRDEAEWVPSHNDLKPPNTLYDGERFWLVDWEAAFLNDRYVDLAVVANFVASTEAESDALLAAYFGAPPDARQRARFFLMSQIVSVAYVAVFALIAARAGVAWEPGATVPAFRDFHRRIVAGELDLGEPGAKRLYAHVHLDKALEQMRSPRFADAVALVGAGRPAQSGV